MSKSPIHAFFVGRALAEGLYELVESTITNTLSNLGKFDAEQREWLRQFTEQILERSNQEAQTSRGSDAASGTWPDSPADLQAAIDELRAEIAQLRAELQRYRNRVA